MHRGRVPLKYPYSSHYPLSLRPTQLQDDRGGPTRRVPPNRLQPFSLSRQFFAADSPCVLPIFYVHRAHVGTTLCIQSSMTPSRHRFRALLALVWLILYV
jgi:hypothetical protein